MRICLVSSSFYPATFYGGPISATWDLSQELAKKDVEMYISTTNANGNSRLKVNTNRFIKQKEKLFVKYYHEQFINRFSLAFIFGIWDDIRKVDVVYIQYLFHYTVLFSLLFSRMQAKEIIICPRGSFSSFTLSNKLPLLKALWLKLFIKPFSKSINWQASSYLEENDIKRRFPNARVEIINDGVDFSSFQQFNKYEKNELLEKYTNTQFKAISNIFFSMGRLHAIKAFDVLIDAFSLFIKEDTNAKLIIAGGDDGVGEKLKQQIIDLKLQDSVFLIGAIDFEDKKTLLNNCDYFTLASEFESFGIVVAEALACGKPIVLSNKTPWKDLEKNKCGILVDNEKNSFSNAFSKVIKEKYDSKAIKNYIQSNYDWSIITDCFLANIKNK
ncbi:MAG: glycosyltransferase [Pelagibacterales bacterium]|nr:glycosyltransferase [Pelagibacterales bacterium]